MPFHASGSARLYRDPEVLELEQERIFARTWQFVGHVAQLPEPGGYLTAQAGLEPVLVVRDADGELHAFRNVCRHRGSRLLSGSGECGKAIRCRYHGWTYRFDGQLIGVPEGRRSPPRQVAARALPRARGGLLGPGLREPRHGRHAAGRPGRRPARALRALRAGTAGASRPTTARQPANWKIVVDNYLEGYHVPIAHPGLMRLLDYKHYGVELHENWACSSRRCATSRRAT